MVGFGSVDNTSDVSKTSFNCYSNCFRFKSKTSERCLGIDKTMVGLGNVNNTSDLAKPISTATQSVLDLKLL
jgi:hypothetical protein